MQTLCKGNCDPNNDGINLCKSRSTFPGCRPQQASDAKSRIVGISKPSWYAACAYRWRALTCNSLKTIGRIKKQQSHLPPFINHDNPIYHNVQIKTGPWKDSKYEPFLNGQVSPRATSHSISWANALPGVKCRCLFAGAPGNRDRWHMRWHRTPGSWKLSLLELE